MLNAGAGRGRGRGRAGSAAVPGFPPGGGGGQGVGVPGLPAAGGGVLPPAVPGFPPGGRGRGRGVGVPGLPAAVPGFPPGGGGGQGVGLPDLPAAGGGVLPPAVPGFPPGGGGGGGQGQGVGVPGLPAAGGGVLPPAVPGFPPGGGGGQGQGVGVPGLPAAGGGVLPLAVPRLPALGGRLPRGRLPLADCKVYFSYHPTFLIYVERSSRDGFKLSNLARRRSGMGFGVHGTFGHNNLHIIIREFPLFTIAPDVLRTIGAISPVFKRDGTVDRGVGSVKARALTTVGKHQRQVPFLSHENYWPFTIRAYNRYGIHGLAAHLYAAAGAAAHVLTRVLSRTLPRGWWAITGANLLFHTDSYPPLYGTIIRYKVFRADGFWFLNEPVLGLTANGEPGFVPGNRFIIDPDDEATAPRPFNVVIVLQVPS